MEHHIIISSSYSKGTRIALHFSGREDLSTAVQDVINKIYKQCGEDTSIAPHYITSEEASWDAVVACDIYFEDLLVIDNVDEFIELIQADRKLTGQDVAKYVLSQVKCTHLKLQKLVYFCYADYLVKYNKKIFEDSIFAFQYGPVVDTVYQQYRNTEKQILEEDDLISSKVDMMPSRSRILFAEGGVSKIYSINDTLEKYKDCTASQLVKLTHQENSPWSLTDRTPPYNVIEDDVIKANHLCE